MKKTRKALIIQDGRVLATITAKKGAEIEAALPDGHSRRDMRCTHVGAGGIRCRARSRGPRFRYRCGAHPLT